MAVGRTFITVEFTYTRPTTSIIAGTTCSSARPWQQSGSFVYLSTLPTLVGPFPQSNLNRWTRRWHLRLADNLWTVLRCRLTDLPSLRRVPN